MLIDLLSTDKLQDLCNDFKIYIYIVNILLLFFITNYYLYSIVARKYTLHIISDNRCFAMALFFCIHSRNLHGIEVSRVCSVV